MPSKVMENVFSMLGNDVTINYNQPSIDNQILTEGYVRKVYALYKALKKAEGRVEAYLIPLRREDESFTRDFYVPVHSSYSSGHVEVEPEGFQEFNNSNTQNLCADGWSHFHPEYFGANPSPTDASNNLTVIKQMAHNEIAGSRETLMKNMKYELKGDSIILSHLLTGERYGLPASEFAGVLDAWENYRGGKNKQFEEEKRKFFDWFFKEGPGFKVMSRFQRIELIYAKSTIFTCQNLEEILRLDGTPENGFSNYIYAEAIVREYWDGKPVGGMSTIRNLPIKILHGLDDDVRFTEEEMEELVNYKIVEPRKRREAAKKVSLPAVEEKGKAYEGEEPKTTETTPSEKVIVEKDLSLIAMLWAVFREYLKRRKNAKESAGETPAEKPEEKQG